ncbi:hypothetical protein [Microvirga soli]|uniref:hypothetical protein n=1 Tax=Microvirga soli TaxID=1854496 RepID=UPI00191D1CE4|nr:hypothetical protein [Microvirga soli]
MSYSRKLLIVLVATSTLQIAPITPSSGAEQAISRQSDCTRVGGKLRPSGFKPSDNLPYVCTYPGSHDRKCKRQMKDDTAYYDIADKKCVSEFMCEEWFVC